MNRLLEWMEILSLDNCDPQMVYKNKFICAAHFASDCSSPGTKKLNANAKPTLNLISSGIYNILHQLITISIPF